MPLLLVSIVLSNQNCVTETPPCITKQSLYQNKELCFQKT